MQDIPFDSPLAVAVVTAIRSGEVLELQYQNTPLQAAQESGNEEVCAWLRGLGAKTADELK